MYFRSIPQSSSPTRLTVHSTSNLNFTGFFEPQNEQSSFTLFELGRRYCLSGSHALVLGPTQWCLAVHVSIFFVEHEITAVKRGRRNTKYGHRCPHLPLLCGAGSARFQTPLFATGVLRPFGFLIPWSVVSRRNGRTRKGAYIGIR